MESPLFELPLALILGSLSVHLAGVPPLNDIQLQGVYVRTLDGLINTRGLGKLAPLVIGLLTGLAEVERSLIQERTKESVEHRRKTGGNLGGRPKTSDKKERLVVRLREEGESYRSIRDQTGLSLATVQRPASPGVV
jgi:DNA invertase Pin-like site-specific DNA recombinase